MPTTCAASSRKRSTRLRDRQIPDLQFDHLGVIVPDISAGRDFLQRSLGVSRWGPLFEDEALGVNVQFGTSGDGLVYELVAPRSNTSPISNGLRSGKHILNHVAYRTADIAASGAVLLEQGCFAVGDPKPAVAYGQRCVQFFISPLRFVIELVEAPEHRHEYETGVTTQ